MGGVCLQGAAAQLVFTASASLDVYSHRLREGGCLLFCGFQPSVLGCIVSIPCLPPHPAMFLSFMNVRVRNDAPSGSPQDSQLVTS